MSKSAFLVMPPVAEARTCFKGALRRVTLLATLASLAHLGCVEDSRCRTKLADPEHTPEAVLQRDIQIAGYQWKVMAQHYEVALRDAQLREPAKDFSRQLEALAFFNADQLRRAEQARAAIGTFFESAVLPTEDVRLRLARAEARVAAHREVLASLQRLIEIVRMGLHAPPRTIDRFDPWEADKTLPPS
jgi:hypothetical protein